MSRVAMGSVYSVILLVGSLKVVAMICLVWSLIVQSFSLNEQSGFEVYS